MDSDAPYWVIENPLILRLLGKFIDKRDNNVTPRNLYFRITQSTAPELFHQSPSEVLALLNLIKDNLQAAGIVDRVEYPRKKDLSKEAYENARIYFNGEAEPIVRHWLNRPKVDPYVAEWNVAIREFPDNATIQLLHASPIRYRSKTPEEIIRGFAQVGKTLRALKKMEQSISLYSLSAKCFQGDSKFLKNREDKLQLLFGDLTSQIEPRPYLVSALISKRIDRVIFVENQDSFLALVDAVVTTKNTETMSVVYCSGFSGTAMNLRTVGSTRFTLINPVNSGDNHQFENWWYNKNALQPTICFWGDLDFSAMAILGALRRSFDGVSAWKPGYNAMLQFHQQGCGHKLADAGKEKQIDPNYTGCHFSDQILLPAMRESSRFLDQEIVGYDELVGLLKSTVS